MNVYRKYVLIILLLGMLAACNKSPYTVSIGNHTGQGIIFYDLPVATRNLWKEKNMYPTIPGTSTGLSRFPHFIGDKNFLPDIVTIKWQLAKLKNCKHETKSRELGEYSKEVAVAVNSEIYSWKMDCDWFPLPDKIFETNLDLREFQKSEAFLNQGKDYKGVQMSSKTAGIYLAFYGENDIRMMTYSGNTNPIQ